MQCPYKMSVVAVSQMKPFIT